MSTWGPGLFSSDLSADVRNTYRDLLEDQVADEEATARTIEQFDVGEGDESHELWLALAATQHKVGRLDDTVRDRALAIIDSGAGLGWWTEEGGRALSRRRAVLATLREQLTGPQPPRRAMRRPRRRGTSDLSAGMILAYTAGGEGRGRHALWRVLQVQAGRTEDTPVLGWLAWDGEQVPTVEELQRLHVRNEQTLVQPADPDEDPPAQSLARPAIYSIHQGGQVDWRSSGFELVGTVDPHPGDSGAEGWFGMDWRGLALTASYHLTH